MKLLFRIIIILLIYFLVKNILIILIDLYFYLDMILNNRIYL